MQSWPKSDSYLLPIEFHPVIPPREPGRVTGLHNASRSVSVSNRISDVNAGTMMMTDPV